MPKQTKKTSRGKKVVRNYTPYHAFEVEGERIGIMSCLKCGAGIVIDGNDNVGVHEKWHESLLLPTSKSKKK